MDTYESNNSRTSKLIALCVTIGIHLCLLVLLSFLTMKAVPASVKDDGIQVMLEEEAEEEKPEEIEDIEEIKEPEPVRPLNPAIDGKDAGLGSPANNGRQSQSGGDNARQPKVPANPTQGQGTQSTSPKPSPPTQQRPNVRQDNQAQTNNANVRSQTTQNRERTVASNANTSARQQADESAARQRAEQARQQEAARRQAEAEAAARRKAEQEEAARRKAEEDARRQQASGRVGNAFGNSNRQQQGSGQGNASSGQGNSQGQGVGGVGTSARVGSRTVLSLPKPDYTDKTSQGTVTVSIVVNKAGNVISATVTSGNTSQALKNAALAAAKRAKFSAGDNDAEKGTITYRFKRN